MVSKYRLIKLNSPIWQSSILLLSKVDYDIIFQKLKNAALPNELIPILNHWKDD